MELGDVRATPTNSSRRSFDCAGAKNRTCFAQDDTSFIVQAFIAYMFVDTA